MLKLTTNLRDQKECKDKGKANFWVPSIALNMKKSDVEGMSFYHGKKISKVRKNLTLANKWY